MNNTNKNFDDDFPSSFTERSLPEIIRPSKNLRVHCVSVRLNALELQQLNNNRGDHTKGEWLRKSALQQLPVVIPEVNKDAWNKLAVAVIGISNLTVFLQRKKNNTELLESELNAIKAKMNRLRDVLTGLDQH